MNCKKKNLIILGELGLLQFAGAHFASGSQVLSSKIQALNQKIRT